MTTPHMERWIHAIEPTAPPSYWEMIDWLQWKVGLLDKLGDDRCVLSEIIEGLRLYEAVKQGRYKNGKQANCA